MKSIFFCLAPLGLIGCATTYTPDPDIPSNVTLTPAVGKGAQYIESVNFSYPVTTRSQEKTGKCVALHVDKNSVQLSDSSRSFVGPYTGNFYNVDRSQTVQGGQAMEFNDSSKGVAVASGRTGFAYMFGITPISKVVDYKVLVDASGDEAKIQFANIKVAQQQTGYAANAGFTPAGAWEGAKPVGVHDALKGVADKIGACLQQSAL